VRRYNLISAMFFLGYFRRKFEEVKRRGIESANTTLDSFLKVGFAILFLFTLVWLSVFLYIAFYYTYVPSVEHAKTVNLQFRECTPEDSETYNEDVKGVCSFPTAHVQLSKSFATFMIGQPYEISLVLDVPESEVNRQLGMFMVCGELVGRNGIQVAHSCKSSILKYQSPLLKMITTISLAPMYVSGVLEERQSLNIPLFSSFEEDQNVPVSDMYLEIKTEHLQVYSAKVQIDAHLRGLRYVMYHWPLASAAFGVSFNLSVVLFIALLSWHHLFNSCDSYGGTFIIKRLGMKNSEEDESKGSEEEVDEVILEKKKIDEKPVEVMGS